MKTTNEQIKNLAVETLKHHFDLTRVTIDSNFDLENDKHSRSVYVWSYGNPSDTLELHFYAEDHFTEDEIKNLLLSGAGIMQEYFQNQNQ